ncbi:MAG: ABC transporter ATP-binding protein [SAR324 cluster bacterium]|nr:ABC transporter ATP-binding protein [SAR324 cluster bacterium]
MGFHTVGRQIDEVLKEHTSLGKQKRAKRIIELFEKVGIPDPEQRISSYPHQFSGGMRQRVMIAMALACSPQLLIADEPTTALDVTTQVQILEQIRKLREESGMSMIFISHDLDVVGYLSDRVAVMYAGEIVEISSVKTLVQTPSHPYTCALQEARPSEERNSFVSIPGNVPPLSALPPGCRFYDRCSRKMARCQQEHPDLIVMNDQHQVRCFLYS